MVAELENTAAEVKRLRACINDLIGVVALPAIWGSGEPSHIVRTLVEVLVDLLRLDFIYVRLKDPIGETPIGVVQVAQSGPIVGTQEIGETLDRLLGAEPHKWPSHLHTQVGGGDVSIVPLQLGLYAEIGMIVAGARRTDFPLQIEKLVLNVAANQAAVGLQEARLLKEQKRVAKELDQRVSQRTAELAAANEELRKEIAERKLAEEKLSQEERDLRRSKAFLTEAQRLSSTGSFSWRADTNEITWSDQLYRIFELDPNVPVTPEIIGSRVHPDDILLFDEMIDWMRRECRDFETEHRLQMPNRSVKYLRIVAHGTEDRSGRREYVGAIQDVTERRLSEEALSKAQSQLAHVTRVTSLGVLTASIAHEVNQPLAGIVTNASTCLHMLANDPPDINGARETARRTIRDANRASDVMSRLRALFNKKDTSTESVNLNEAAREVIALSKGELQRNRVILRTHLADDLPRIAGDRIQLQQVILNLVLNASAAMSGVDDRSRQLTIRTERAEDDVCLTVRDTGVGFDSQNVDRLFDAFYSTKNGGMGIGLSISRSIIESHHGHLSATPNDGPGATFSFSIPFGPSGHSSSRHRSRPIVSDAHMP